LCQCGIISANVVFKKQNLEADFVPLGFTIKNGSYDYTQYNLSISSDQSKKLSASFTANLRQFYNGNYNSHTAGVSFAPILYVFISQNIQVGKMENVEINNTSKNVTLYAVEGTIALNPRVQPSGLFQ
jgi:hypothetical protein